MTKIGEGKTPAPEPTVKTYQKALEESAGKFENALQSYQVADDTDQRMALKSIMDQQLALIRSAVQEIKRGGMYKEEVLVESDYQKFVNNPSPENIAALEHDLQTLRDYNKL